jgi:hypothetical protein
MTALQRFDETAISPQESLVLRRKATNAVIDMVCQTSPAQSAFRDAGRRMQQLRHRLNLLNQCGANTDAVHDQWLDCIDRQFALLRLIDRQWSGLMGTE